MKLIFLFLLFFVNALAQNSWIQDQKIVSVDGTTPNRFGYSVSFYGNYVLVGAPYATVGSNTQQGAAYIYSNSSNLWTVEQQLVASGGVSYDNFGASVVLSGNYAVVGAPFAKIGTNLGQGAVYIFQKHGNLWTQLQKITASDGGYDSYFGASVAMDGTNILVGAYFNSQAAYFFTQSGNLWTQQQKIVATPSFSVLTYHFGYSVAIYQNISVVGDPQAIVNSNSGQGAAYVFTYNGTAWVQQQELFDSSFGYQYDNFGNSIAINGSSTILIGTNPDYQKGRVYFYAYGSGSWNQQVFYASDSAMYDRFGCSISLNKNMLLVGASNSSVGTNVGQGAAYIFSYNGTWNQNQKLTASDGVAGDRFGYQVSTYGNYAIISNFLSSQTSAYIFDDINLQIQTTNSAITGQTSSTGQSSSTGQNSTTTQSSSTSQNTSNGLKKWEISYSLYIVLSVAFSLFFHF